MTSAKIQASLAIIVGFIFGMDVSVFKYTRTQKSRDVDVCVCMNMYICGVYSIVI